MPISKAKKKKREEKIKAFFDRLGIIFLGTVLVIILITFVSRLEYFEIRKVDLEIDGVIDKSEILDITADVISGSYVFLPRRNFLIYPKEELDRALRFNIPRIKDLDIKRVDLNTLKISVKERDSEFLWCGESPEKSKECFYVDENGFVYSPAPFFSGHVFFRYYGGDVDLDQPIRSYVTSPDKLEEIREFILHIENLDLRSNAVYINNEDQKIKIFLKGEGHIYLNSEGSLEEDFSKLHSFFRGSTEELVVDGDPAFYYLDLRFDGRVYRKMKENEQ